QLLVVSWSVANGGGFYPTVGASGGVFGLLLAYGLLFPHQRVMLLIPPVPMKARTLVIVYGLIALVLGVTGTQSGVGRCAARGGRLVGGRRFGYWRGRPRFGGPRLGRVVWRRRRRGMPA